MDVGQRLVHLVDATYAHEENEDGMRSHLGASVLGEKCMRQVWFGFRWAGSEQFDGRMLRLFARGHHEEEMFVDLLRRLGAKVWTHDAEGKQFRISAHGGHMGGSMDGVVVGLPDLPAHVPKDAPVLLELKTHNTKWFKLLLTKGLKEAHPKHYRQAQVYMFHSGLKYCLYCAVNKNDDSLWFHFFELDPTIGQYLTQRAETIIFGTGTPPRISETPTWHECRFCALNDVCFGRKMPRVNCRTCAHAKPEHDGTWSCGQSRPEITTQPKKGCPRHIFHPMFMPHAHAIEFAGTHVVYQHKGQTIINGPEPGQTPSECLDLTC